jgi:transposase
VGADAKLSNADHATNLTKLGFLTRIPGTLTLVSQMITQVLTWDTWHRLDETTRYHPMEFCHSGMAQRWLVVSSPAALERAEASVHTACQREAEAIVTQVFHVQARRFETPSSAHEAWSTLADTWSDHQGESSALIDHKHYAKQGRPTADTPIKAIAWPMQAQVRPDAERRGGAKQRQACCVLGTNIEVEQRSDAEVMAGYKGQAQAEGGCRFLTDPLFFVSSLCVKKPSRMQGLVMVMT